MTNTVSVIYMGSPTGSADGCKIYRGNMPVYHLVKEGNWRGGWYYWDQLIADGLMGNGSFMQLIEQSDVLVFPRLFVKSTAAAEPIKLFFDLVRSYGKKVVYEVDDDYTNEHRQVIDGDAISIAKEADAITVSTPYLGQLMTDRTGLKTYLLPNMIDPALWKGAHIEKKIPDDHLIIGLTGSTTHDKDWEVLATVLPRVLEENPHVHLIVGGYHPEYLSGLPQTEYFPPLPYDTGYAQTIKACDIILTPVDPDDRFNLSKSPIKVIEGMAAERLVGGTKAGAACIATDNPVYRLAIRHGVNGMLAEHTPESWYTQINTLIHDAELRKRIQLKGYQWVYLHHNMAQGWRKWAKAYREILAS